MVREFLRALEILLSDLIIEEFQSGIEAGKLGLVEDSVPVVPLVPGKVVELLHELCHPPLDGSIQLLLFEVALLDYLPPLDRETLQHVLPSKLVLLMKGLNDFIIPGIIVKEGLIRPPLVESGKKAAQQSRVCVKLPHLDLQFGKVLLPDGGGILTYTLEDVGTVFMFFITPGALGIILEVPLDHGLTNSTVLRGMFGDPSPSGSWEGSQSSSRGAPVNVVSRGCREPVMPGPVHGSDRVLDQFVEGLVVRTDELLLSIPKGDAFIVDMHHCRCHVVPSILQLFPVQLGK